MDLSPKQRDFYLNADGPINLAMGSVSSGKSFAANLAFLKWTQVDQPGDMMIVGQSHHTIKRNVVNELVNLAGGNVRPNYGIQEVMIGKRRVHIVGASDERAERRIRGSTLLGCLVDEATIVPESFFTMLVSRLRLPGARLFGTTNPDNPFHWLKAKWIDRSDEVGAKVWQFTLDDNPSLSKEYKERLHRQYTGLWYQRYIEGKWVLAEGTVYDFFDPDIHVIPHAPDPAEFYIVGVDYGTTNPTAFALIGCSLKSFPNLWLEQEYYWDSTMRLVQKTDTEYAEDLRDFLKGKNVVAVYMDPAAASFKLECSRAGIRNILDADNDVLNGVRFVSQLMKNGDFKLCANTPNAQKEMMSYVWDQAAAARGIDKPKKANDHILDAMRYGLVSHFMGKERDTSALRSQIKQARDEKLYGKQANLPFPFNVSRDQAYRPGAMRR
jgi:PBSX family phage terminase large subunit